MNFEKAPETGPFFLDAYYDSGYCPPTIQLGHTEYTVFGATS